MPLGSGTKLGPYEIVSALGAGGMGEVYRARDTKLGRDVALKVIHGTFAIDAERLARFKREAQVLASLNHPHIGAIYGFEDSGETHALVLELVEGETLADRIARGAIPLAEALPIARQIAEALEAAHEQGIIHRDLKPSNIQITPNSDVKVLDFGLAKLAESAGSTQKAVDSAHLSMSPTITSPAMMTGVGVLLGTAPYMAPEQAKGKPADKRSDAWAFGCVFYEMLAGKRAFEGEDISDTLAAVLRGEPDWSALPADMPPAITALIRQCLDRDRRTRIADLSVVRFVFDNVSRVAQPAISIDRTPANASRWRVVLPWAIAGLLGLALAAATWFGLRREAPEAPAARLLANVGADVSLATNLGASAVPSPDGKVLALIATRELGLPAQLYVRRLDQLQATPLGGTEGAASPFFAPDGQWIGFFAGGKLKKISVTGGAAVTLCDAANARGGSWGDDGTIIFQPAAIPGVLERVSAEGGKPEPIAGQADQLNRWPQVLPGSKAVLFTMANGTSGSVDTADLAIQQLSDRQPRILVRGGYYGRYVRSGHILYMHQGTLFAVPFDLNRLEMSGPPVPALEGVATSPGGNGGTQYAVSDTGTAAYVPGESQPTSASIQWMDSAGKTTPLRAVPSDWSNPALSPDGRTLAMDITDGSQADIWTYDWARDTLTRLTFDPADDLRPVWTPDGRRIVFASKRADKTTLNLYWQRADGTGDVQRLTESKTAELPGSWDASGKFLAFDEVHGANDRDLMILRMEGDEKAGWKPGKPSLFLGTPFAEAEPMFSPDGRWIAYISNESGHNEVYVRPFPGPGGKWQVSNGPADDPTWSRAAHELFFASTLDVPRVMVTSYTVEGDSFRADKPQSWSTGQFAARPRPPSRDFDLHPDGKRLVVAAGSAQTNAKLDTVVLMFNLFDQLRRIAPPK